MESVFLFLLMVILFGGIGMAFFKYRASIRKWLHDPKYGSSWYPTRRTYLKRRIEDSEAELEWLDNKTDEVTGE